MKTILLPAILFLGFISQTFSQCTPLGDQTSYGTGNVWIGYVYENADLSGYIGYVNEGSAVNPNFDEDFGGNNVTYTTNGCGTNTSTFSVRYKLQKSFIPGGYDITVGGDDGYRLSIDGGATWIIDRWLDQGYRETSSYNVLLSGTTNLVLEYYENQGDNRISFSISPACLGTENENIYGTGNVWIGYLYKGMNFNHFKGVVTEGLSGNPNFNENFGGNDVNLPTSGCNIQTEAFSARYRLRKYFPNGSYTLSVGGDDGYRLSLDGGSSWVIDRWFDQGYNTSFVTLNLNGTYDMVIEYYENGGGNQLSFDAVQNSTLPVTLTGFSAARASGTVLLDWKITSDSDPRLFEIERSADGIGFTKIATIAGADQVYDYHYSDMRPLNSRSYYRLKMTDRSGIAKYSGIATVVSAESATASITVFPTLVQDRVLKIQSQTTLIHPRVQLRDGMGRVVLQQNWASLNAYETGQITVPATLGSAVYFLEVYSGNKRVATNRIVIQ